MSEPRKVAVFISGRGSNLRALLESEVGSRISLVLTDNPRAPGLVHAGEHRVCTVAIGLPGRERFEAAALRHLKIHRPCLVVLAGFMRILSADFIRSLGGWAVNIHPSLLPDLPGLHTHRRALQAGMGRHGCTVHWVNADVDGGPIIAQAEVGVHADDDEDSLGARVLEAEHRLYPSTVAKILSAGILPGGAMAA